MQLLYVNSTSCDEVPHKRIVPAIKEWNTSMLRKREAYEFNNGGFGKLQLNQQNPELQEDT